MSQYWEVAINGVSRASAHAFMDYFMDKDQFNPKGADVYMACWRPEDGVLRVGVGGENLDAFKAALRSSISVKLFTTANVDVARTIPSDMNPYCRVITSSDMAAGISMTPKETGP